MDRNKVKKKLFVWYLFFWIILAFALYQAYGVYFLDLTSTKSKWVGLFAGALGTLFASLKVCEITFISSQNTVYKQIAKYFQDGLFVYNFKLNRFVLLLGLFASILLAKTIGLQFTLCFICGIVSIIAINGVNNYIFNRASTKANAFCGDIESQIKINICCAIATTFFTVCFAIIPIVILYHAFKDYQIISGYALGVGLFYFCSATSFIISKFAIKITKEPLLRSFQNLTIEDKRNPLLLLNGMLGGALKAQHLSNDIYLSYCIGFIGAITVGAFCLNLMGAFLPIIILANGIFASIICTLIARINNFMNQIKTFSLIFLLNIVIFSTLTYWTIKTWLLNDKGLVISVLAGAFYAFICYLVNLAKTSSAKSSKDIINSASLGQYSTLVQITKASFKNIFTPVILLVATILVAFIAPKGIEAPLLGIYGITLSICGFLSTTTIIYLMQNYAFAFKNTSCVLKTYKQELKQEKDDTQEEEQAQKFILATKDFLTIATFLSSLSAFISYTLICYIEEMDILNPYILVNLIFGSVIGLLYVSKMFSASSKNALKLIIESKRQFRKKPAILEYQENPNYEQPIKVLLNNNIIQISYIIVLLVFILCVDLHYLKYEAIAGLLFGMIIIGFSVSIFANNLKNITSKAKIYFENNYYNAKETKEYGIISNLYSISQIPCELISQSYDALIKFIAIILLSLAIMFV